MRDLYLETVGPCGECAVLRIVGEIDIYTAPALRERLERGRRGRGGLAA